MLDAGGAGVASGRPWWGWGISPAASASAAAGRQRRRWLRPHPLTQLRLPVPLAGGYCMLVGATLKPRTVMDLAAGLVLNVTA